MDNSTVSTLSPPPSDVLDIDDIQKDDQSETLSSAYAVALFLHPKFRFNYFKRRWTIKTLKPYLKLTLLAIRKL